MTNWIAEINELHEVFVDHFLGTTNNLARVEAALAEDFSIVSPSGRTATRQDTLDGLAAAHAQHATFTITIDAPELIFESGELLVASYIERQVIAQQSSARQSTVVFRIEPSGPNGLRWVRVHETWIEQP